MDGGLGDRTINLLTWDQAFDLVTRNIAEIAPSDVEVEMKPLLDGREVVVRGVDKYSFLAIFANPDETIINAGARSKFELDALSEDLNACLTIVQGILAGRLVEIARRRTSKFELQLDNGQNLSGKVTDFWRHPFIQCSTNIMPFTKDD